jgi:hypothetical protein
MKHLLSLSLILTSLSSFAETKIVCSNQEIIFNPKTGYIEGRAIADSANAVNAQIKALEDQGKKVKVAQQSIAYGGFQAVAAGVNNNFINSKAVQYPTICVTLEIE